MPPSHCIVTEFGATFTHKTICLYKLVMIYLVIHEFKRNLSRDKGGSIKDRKLQQYKEDTKPAMTYKASIKKAQKEQVMVIIVYVVCVFHYKSVGNKICLK